MLERGADTPRHNRAWPRGDHAMTEGRMLSRGLLAAGITLICCWAQAQPSPPCGDTYGTTSERTAIEDAMYSGTAQDCIDAINAAKETRGNRVGCTSDTWSYATPNTTHPTLSQLE